MPLNFFAQFSRRISLVGFKDSIASVSVKKIPKKVQGHSILAKNGKKNHQTYRHKRIRMPDHVCIALVKGDFGFVAEHGFFVVESAVYPSLAIKHFKSVVLEEIRGLDE
jgi:hypothetical protein